MSRGHRSSTGSRAPVRAHERLLYVANDATSALDVFDIDDGHRWLRSIAIPGTHVLAKEIGPFSSSVRPFTVDEAEAHAYANLTNLLGFAAIDLASGGIQEIAQETPAERRSHPEASAGRPHAGGPFSHGIALRPGSRELWFLDDEWGYLYVYDTSTSPPSHQTDVPLFTDLTRPWTQGAYRWVAFDIDGRYCYPSDGSVVDAETKALVPGAHISPSEKLIAIDFEGGRPVRVSGQNGGAYPPGSP